MATMERGRLHRKAETECWRPIKLHVIVYSRSPPRDAVSQTTRLRALQCDFDGTIFQRRHACDSTSFYCSVLLPKVAWLRTVNIIPMLKSELWVQADCIRNPSLSLVFDNRISMPHREAPSTSRKHETGQVAHERRTGHKTAPWWSSQTE